jgi:hypothetical protein
MVRLFEFPLAPRVRVEPVMVRVLSPFPVKFPMVIDALTVGLAFVERIAFSLMLSGKLLLVQFVAIFQLAVVPDIVRLV